MFTVVNNRRAPTRIHITDGLTKDGVTNYCTVKLKPGANLLKDEFAAAFQRAQALPDSLVAHWVEDGTLDVREPPKGDKGWKRGTYIKDLSELKELDALEAVTKSKSVKDLKRWAHQDPREAIQKAIFARHDVLTDNPKLTKDDSADAQ